MLAKPGTKCNVHPTFFRTFQLLLFRLKPALRNELAASQGQGTYPSFIGRPKAVFNRVLKNTLERGMDAVPENKICFGALFSAKLASFRLANLWFANRLLKKSVMDFFNNLLRTKNYSLTGPKTREQRFGLRTSSPVGRSVGK